MTWPSFVIVVLVFATNSVAVDALLSTTRQPNVDSSVMMITTATMETRLHTTTTCLHSTTTSSDTKHVPRSSKFAGLMAGDASCPSIGWPKLDFQSSNKEEGDNWVKTVLLPDDDCSSHVQAPPLHNRRELHYQFSLLSQTQVDSLLKQIEHLETSLQEKDTRCIIAMEDGVVQSNSLSTILIPMLEQNVLPFAQQNYDPCHTHELVIADALVRSYDPSDGKQALAQHYDLSACCTVIIPLNPTECEGGLYVQSGASIETRRDVVFEKAGDAVLHRFDVMHGVQVRKGRRYSLVVWLAEKSTGNDTSLCPWIAREQTNSVHAAFLHANNAKEGRYGTPQDLLVAQRLFEWAAERGHAHSQYGLALLFLQLRENKERVAQLLQQASDNGLAVAQNMLGTSYKQGYNGLPVDYTLAKKYLHLAAGQGHGLSLDILNDDSRWP